MRTVEKWTMSTLPIPSIPGRLATVEDRLYRDDGVKWERMYTETEVRAVRAEALENVMLALVKLPSYGGGGGKNFVAREDAEATIRQLAAGETP